METYKRGLILDSSIWVAFLHETDSQHGAAEKLLADIHDDIFVPEYVLVEVATILKRKKRMSEAQRFVVRVLHEKIQCFLPADALILETAKLFCESPGDLSFTDTALLVLSKDYRVLTFDKQLQKAIKNSR